MMIAAVSEIARRSPGFAALLASLPMFLVAPALLRRGLAFWPALAL